jgi:membrane protease YdiL (CAAX protease family)
MKEYVRSLSPRSEFLVVILGAFGVFLPGNVAALFGASQGASLAHPPISDGYLLSLIAYELVILMCLGGFLTMRGWTLARIGVTPTVRDSVIGVALMVASYIVNVAVVIAAANVAPATVLASLQVKLVAGSIAPTTIIATSLVNALFEELFVCGYLVSVLKERRGFMFAVNVSTALRATYHLYQGVAGVLAIVPLGLIFAYWYARTGRLWPLIVAHGLMDLMALAYYG